ncbi:MAG: hypothetical protein HQL72_03625 [Magnetococcales bacterium]|nr:hypothetical protein [Magnetococcales bacterium]
MTALTRVIRQTPVKRLRSYFNGRFGRDKIESGAVPGWFGKEFFAPHVLLKSISELDPEVHAAMAMDFDRVFDMTDEPGQQAIIGLLRDQDEWQALENPYDRAMWLFVNDEKRFRRAEEVRYADHNRQGRRWAGFSGPASKPISRSIEHCREFEEAICSLFNSQQAHLELYDRVRFGLQGELFPLTQAVVYREGLPNGRLEFENGKLAVRPYRPVLEAVITYDSSTGTIEVVGQDSKSRPRLARLFAEHILRQRIMGIFMPMREYDLSSLRIPRRFPTDPKDGISHVQVMSITMNHKDIPHASFIIDLKQQCQLTPYEFSNQGLAGGDPFGKKEFQICQAVISVHFRPDRTNRRGKIITLKLTLPNGCDLKGKIEKERLVCEKYLPAWGLVKKGKNHG